MLGITRLRDHSIKENQSSKQTIMKPTMNAERFAQMGKLAIGILTGLAILFLIHISNY